MTDEQRRWRPFLKLLPHVLHGQHVKPCSPRSGPVTLTPQRRRQKTWAGGEGPRSPEMKRLQPWACLCSASPWYKEAFTSEFKYGLGALHKIKFIKAVSPCCKHTLLYFLTRQLLEPSEDVSCSSTLSMFLLLREIPQIQPHLNGRVSQNRRKLWSWRN